MDNLVILLFSVGFNTATFKKNTSGSINFCVT